MMRVSKRQKKEIIMAGNVNHIMMCPLCLDTMRKPILQCKTGHSMCGSCIKDDMKICPTCRGPLSTTRNYLLEQLIESDLKMPCYFADNGCKYQLTNAEKSEHEMECKNRRYLCEGSKFAKWKCSWVGNYEQLEDHFQQVHGSDMSYKADKKMKIQWEKNFLDVQIISFFNGSKFFWYKHKVDAANEKAYWTFQLIGPKKQAENCFYEFEILNGPIKKFKVTEICTNDVVDANVLFQTEKCVAITFKTLKNFVDSNGDLHVKFRLMTVKKPNANSK